MDSIQEIIQLMNNEDKLAFIHELKSRNKRKDVKNMGLFKILETDDLNKLTKFKKTLKSQDAYHALRKRLHDALIEFLSNRIFENNTGELNKSLRYLVLSRFFLEHQLPKKAIQFLMKAEEQAISHEQFNLLNEIYQTQLDNIHFLPENAVDNLIEKVKINLRNLENETKLNMVYGLLRNQLKHIHSARKIVNFEELIQNLLQEFQLDLREVLTYKSLHQILFIANEFANIQQDFTRVEPFVKKAIRMIENRQETNPFHQKDRIQILYFLANFYFRTNQFQESTFYLNQMKEEMLQTSKLPTKIEANWTLLTALNLHFTGKPNEALSELETILKNARKLSTEEIYDLHLTRILILAQTESPLVRKELTKMNHSDAYFEKKMGMLWTIRKNLMEIILYFEEDELALSRILSFKRRYKKYLLDVKEARVLDFLSFLEELLRKPEKRQNLAFKERVQNFLNKEKPIDPFIQCFYAWLHAKLEKKNAYEELLKKLSKK
jgi:hypothetical protein